MFCVNAVAHFQVGDVILGSAGTDRMAWFLLFLVMGFGTIVELTVFETETARKAGKTRNGIQSTERVVGISSGATGPGTTHSTDSVAAPGNAGSVVLEQRTIMGVPVRKVARLGLMWTCTRISALLFMKKCMGMGLGT